MNTTGTRPHRLEGDLKDYQFRLTADDLAAMRTVAHSRGWSLAEAMRRAVSLFLRQNMDNGPYTIEAPDALDEVPEYGHLLPNAGKGSGNGA